MWLEKKKKIEIRFSVTKISALLLFYIVRHSHEGLKTSLYVPNAYLLNYLKCLPSQINDFLHFWSVDFVFISHPKLSKIWDIC